MMGPSHLMIGVGSGALLGALMGVEPLNVVAAMAVAGVGALLPDIDHRHAPIRQRLGFVGDILLFWLPHRGLTHSLLCWAFVTALALLGTVTFLKIAILLPLALSVGYASHLLADMMTIQGLPILYPWKANFYLLPRGLRVTTGGLSEMLALMIVIQMMVVTIGQLQGWLILRLPR